MRRLVPSDTELLYELDSDPEVRRYVHAGPPDLDRIRSEILPRMCADYGRDRGFWAAERKPTREFVGWFQLRPEAGADGDDEIGYRLRRAVWGQGLATEGVRALVAKAFAEPATSRVVAVTLIANRGSQRVLEKVGFERAEDFIYEPPPEADAPPDEERRACRYVLTRSNATSHAPERKDS